MCQEEVKIYKEKFEKSKLVILVDYRGINISDVTKVRANLRKSGTEYKVAKNSTLKFAAPAAGAAGAAEEKSSFNVVLKEAGANKIAVIKAVREATGLGLKEAKELVDGAPKTVKENVSKEDAENLQKALVDAGAVVELQ